MKAVRFFQTIQLKLIIIYVLLILFAMQLIGAYFVQTLENTFRENFSESMTNEVMLLADYVGSNLAVNAQGSPEEAAKAREELDSLVKEWVKSGNADIQILDANGVVITTTQSNSESIINQKNTQQIVTRALQNIKDEETGKVFTDLDGNRKKALAWPVLSNGKVVGAVYFVKSMEDMYGTIARINQIFLTGTFIALALTALLGVLLSGTITSPIKEITKQATFVAEGRFDTKLKVYSEDEIGQLTHAFNYMTERLQEALSSNEEEREKLASILTNMNDGVIATDDQNRIMLINRRAKQMLQTTEEETIGRTLMEVLGQAVEAHPIPDNTQETQTYIGIKRSDEEELTVRVTFTPIHRREIGITGTIVVLQDVTEQEKLERSRREFVANVSHELRTPLTTIKSYLEALEDGALEDPELARRFIGVTRNEAERMIRMVNDLLHLSRFDSKQTHLHKQWTDVPEMLEDVADRFSFQLKQRQIGITLDIPDNISRIEVDRDQIDQVLDNLVSNAIKYTGNGGKIVISARQPDASKVEISIEDNGIGIPAKDLERIFERFYRVDKARSRNMGGTGLGLSIAREIIKAHGGEIRIESEVNRGTKVIFVLPVHTPGPEVPDGWNE